VLANLTRDAKVHAAAPQWRLPNPDGCATLGVNKANCLWWGFPRQQLSGSE
jgi:hypothetical protein